MPYNSRMTLDFLKSAKGWRRRGLAALMGICATAALPPFYALPFLIPSFSGLYLLVHYASTRRQAFLDGWWWGFGYFVTGLYWMCISLYVEPEKFAWLTPFALFGVQSVLAIYIGLVTLALHACRQPRETCRIMLFATLWVLTEFVRSYLFTGFPWNLIGYVWTATDTTLQLASVTGVYGLSWLTVLLAALPALFFVCARPWPVLIAGLAVFAAWIGFGVWRLAENPTVYTPVKIRVVQANIEQSLKMTPQSVIANVRKHVMLTRAPGLNTIQAVVWPEASVADAQLAPSIASALAKQTLLLMGAVRYEGDAQHWKAWNTLLAIDASGHSMASYDKHHLVPFGEFIPLRHVLPLENIAGGVGDFTRGPGPATLSVDHLPPFSPLICYEAIFPGEATDGTHAARWLLNITNDAWFGESTGPYQHLAMARTRAVEQGLPLVRAANTGVSAVFDPLGRMLGMIPLGQEGILDRNLPQPVVSVYGGYLSPTCILAIIASICGLSLLISSRFYTQKNC